MTQEDFTKAQSAILASMKNGIESERDSIESAATLAMLNLDLEWLAAWLAGEGFGPVPEKRQADTSDGLDLHKLRKSLDDEPNERWPRESIYPILDRLETAGETVIAVAAQRDEARRKNRELVDEVAELRAAASETPPAPLYRFTGKLSKQNSYETGKHWTIPATVTASTLREAEEKARAIANPHATTNRGNPPVRVRRDGGRGDPGRHLMSAGWFPEELRGALAGYGLRRGREKLHIIRLRIDGPVALSRRALCNGVQGTLLVDSRVDHTDASACFQFLASKTRLIEPLDLFFKLERAEAQAMCTRCREKFLRETRQNKGSDW